MEPERLEGMAGMEKWGAEQMWYNGDSNIMNDIAIDDMALWKEKFLIKFQIKWCIMSRENTRKPRRRQGNSYCVGCPCIAKHSVALYCSLDRGERHLWWQQKHPGEIYKRTASLLYSPIEKHWLKAILKVLPLTGDWYRKPLEDFHQENNMIWLMS